MRILDDRYGGRPITWQQLVIVLSLIGLFAAYVILADHTFSGRTVNLGWWILAISTVNLGCASLSYLIAQTRRDLCPDLIPLAMPDKEVFQAGDAHYALEMVQVGNSICIYLVVQNVRKGEGIFELRFKDVIGPRFRGGPLPLIQVELLPAQALACRIDVPFEPLQRASTFFARLVVTCKASGKRVRFKRHRVLARAPSRAVVWFGLLTGHMLHDEGVGIELPLSAGPEDIGTMEHHIETRTLWSLNDPSGQVSVQNRVQESFSRSS